MSVLLPTKIRLAKLTSVTCPSSMMGPSVAFAGADGAATLAFIRRRRALPEVVWGEDSRFPAGQVAKKAIRSANATTSVDEATYTQGAKIATFISPCIIVGVVTSAYE
jgi:hypothetical protein